MLNLVNSIKIMSETFFFNCNYFCSLYVVIKNMVKVRDLYCNHVFVVMYISSVHYVCILSG
jgi:hypothetical protein